MIFKNGKFVETTKEDFCFLFPAAILNDAFSITPLTSFFAIARVETEEIFLKNYMLSPRRLLLLPQSRQNALNHAHERKSFPPIFLSASSVNTLKLLLTPSIRSSFFCAYAYYENFNFFNSLNSQSFLFPFLRICRVPDVFFT